MVSRFGGDFIEVVSAAGGFLNVFRSMFGESEQTDVSETKELCTSRLVESALQGRLVM